MGRFSPILALVARCPDGPERAGAGLERPPGLALSGGRVGDRLRRREPLRPGAQQPVVGGGGVLPVSGLAAGTYLAMLAASLCMGPATAAPDRRLAWGAMLVLAGAAAGSAVWFTIVQKWVIGAFCPYCMATHLTGLLLAALVLWRAPRQFDDDSTTVAPDKSALPAPAAPRPLIGPWTASAWPWSVWFSPVSWRPARPPFLPRPSIAAARCKKACPPLIPAPCRWSVHPTPPTSSSCSLIINAPIASNCISLLDEAIRRYDGKLAFVLCPTPLNSQCNPYIPRHVEEFKDSCELAKIALAVWAARREAFPVFNRWMFSSEPGDRLASAQPRRRPGQSGRIGRPGEVRCHPGRPLD